MRFLRRVTCIASGLFLDLTDRAAVPRRSYEWLPDAWAASLLALTGAATFADIVDRVASHLLGLPATIIPILLILSGVAWAVFVIRSKSLAKGDNQPLIVGQRSGQLEYTYGQPVRHLAKLGMFVLLVLSPFKISNLLDEFTPLPTTLYGYLIDSKTGEPVSDASIRVVTSEGVDVTTGVWLSDSEGFYIVETTQSVYRSAHLVIHVASCKHDMLPLRRAYQTRVDWRGYEVQSSLAPVFRHVLNCEGGR